jgi:hypothetical protein
MLVCFNPGRRNKAPVRGFFAERSRPNTRAASCSKLGRSLFLFCVDLAFAQLSTELFQRTVSAVTESGLICIAQWEVQNPPGNSRSLPGARPPVWAPVGASSPRCRSFVSEKVSHADPHI